MKMNIKGGVTILTLSKIETIGFVTVIVLAMMTIAHYGLPRI